MDDLSSPVMRALYSLYYRVGRLLYVGAAIMIIQKNLETVNL